MDKKSGYIIKDIVKGSPADRAGLKKGSYLLCINGNEIHDIFDYHYYSDDESLLFLIRGEDMAETEVSVSKRPGEDVGLVFENALLDDYHSCSNKCIFCFIDQMPKGMRDTLYFKDDDTRLSFLQGNYVTLTNIKDEELKRMIDFRLAPINISVHATDPGVRKMMLGNRFAGELLKKMQRIKDADLPMNGQIVLCKGINDGEILMDTVKTLMAFHPQMQSVSIVPVGLTRYREGLYPLSAYTREDCRAVLEEIHKLQDECQMALNTRFIYASDEWYIRAGSPIPKDDYYEGYPQLENGVGMLRLLATEFSDEVKRQHSDNKKREVSIATGELVAPYIKKLCSNMKRKFAGLETNVYPIANEFFGRDVTVSGLVTGGDLIEQLKGKKLGGRLLIPQNMLRFHEKVFLDDVSTDEVQRALGVPVHVVGPDGGELVKHLLG